MANLSRPLAPRQILAREPAPRPRLRLGRVAVVVLVMLALATLAWVDGGEEPLHPIAQPVELPGDAR
ncbi:hypothetical protein [Erythrobacter dokdonensis]|jgi:hypothetical protein|uniref:Uncharacterized protein n=1 Tax=Erythrobacter dokdonensis DSW-74 TaxID=1300349 RepID=A0A1A7BKE4_9SPHN|nr:hypothetical protein [Erythrobacter dokdonensis]MEE4318051.1 hypothetical protein [Erythrobacter sp.]OBV12196.1 hypothetical protein I603_0327 [Erythrobacter dokdonensis DSW-74]